MLAVVSSMVEVVLLMSLDEMAARRRLRREEMAEGSKSSKGKWLEREKSWLRRIVEKRSETS